MLQALQLTVRQRLRYNVGNIFLFFLIINDMLLKQLRNKIIIVADLNEIYETVQKYCDTILQDKKCVKSLFYEEVRKCV